MARPVPQLGVRRRLRLADRRRAGHLRHHRRRVPHDRDGCAHRRSAHRVPADDRVRLRARPGGAAGRRLTTPERMLALHRRLAELLPTAQRAIVLVQAAVLAIAAGAAWGRSPRSCSARRARRHGGPPAPPRPRPVPSPPPDGTRHGPRGGPSRASSPEAAQVGETSGRTWAEFSLPGRLRTRCRCPRSRVRPSGAGRRPRGRPR